MRKRVLLPPSASIASALGVAWRSRVGSRMEMIRRGKRWGLSLVMLAACSQGSGGTNPYGFPPSGPMGPQTATDDGRSTFGSGDEGPGSCCTANGTPGCSDEIIEACVCAVDVACCSTEWTGSCASMVDEFGCGSCIGGPLDTGDVDPDTGGPPPPSGQDCCGGWTEPGCNDPAVEACVCAEIEFCCDTAWEEVCASAVDALHCGTCEGEGETGEEPPPEETTGEPPPPPPPPAGGCCEVNMGPGCTDMAVQDCVCMQDAYCCDTEWDQVCVDEVDEFMCGDCGGGMPPPPPPGENPCCSEQMGAGCGDPLAEACVCVIDSYCCDTQWDSTCALLADLLPCVSC